MWIFRIEGWHAEGINFHLIRGLCGGKRVNADRSIAVANLDTFLVCALLEHEHQDLLLANQGDLCIGVDIINSRRLRQSCQKGGLAQGQIFCGFTEVCFGSGFHPISQVAVINLIQVQLNDLILGVTACNFRREDDLTCLACHRALTAFFGRKDQRARQLLGNSGCAATLSACDIVLPQGARDGNRVEAGIGIELLVFSGNGSSDKVGRNISKRNVVTTPRAWV